MTITKICSKKHNKCFCYLEIYFVLLVLTSQLENRQDGVLWGPGLGKCLICYCGVCSTHDFYWYKLKKSVYKGKKYLTNPQKAVILSLKIRRLDVNKMFRNFVLGVFYTGRSIQIQYLSTPTKHSILNGYKMKTCTIKCNPIQKFWN